MFCTHLLRTARKRTFYDGHIILIHRSEWSSKLAIRNAQSSCIYNILISTAIRQLLLGAQIFIALGVTRISISKSAHFMFFYAFKFS